MENLKVQGTIAKIDEEAKASINKYAEIQKEREQKELQVYNDVCRIIREADSTVLQVKWLLKRIKSDLINNAKI